MQSQMSTVKMMPTMDDAVSKAQDNVNDAQADPDKGNHASSRFLTKPKTT